MARTRKQDDSITHSQVIQTLKSVGIISSELETGFDGYNLSLGEHHITERISKHLYSRKQMNDFIGYYLANHTGTPMTLRGKENAI